jgi:hypothetical protein
MLLALLGNVGGGMMTCVGVVEIKMILFAPHWAQREEVPHQGFSTPVEGRQPNRD